MGHLASRTAIASYKDGAGSSDSSEEGGETHKDLEIFSSVLIIFVDCFVPSCFLSEFQWITEAVYCLLMLYTSHIPILTFWLS